MRRTTFEVLESLFTVSHRMFNYNRVRSIDTIYDNEKAITICLASHNTIFRVRLFKGRSPENIIVKVERLAGCSLIYGDEYRAILWAVKFGEIPAPKKY